MENEFIIRNKTAAPAVERAFGILKMLGEVKTPLGVSAIARFLGIGKSSVHGIVQALLVSGAIEDAGGRKYRLGPLFEDLARKGRAARSFTEICHRYLTLLAERVGQMCLFGTLEKEHFRISLIADGSETFQVKAVPGGTIPLLAGAIGKIAIAWGRVPMPKTLPRFTENTILAPAAFKMASQRAREELLAFDHEEYLQGVYAAASPVLQGNQLLGVILSIGFCSQMGKEGLIVLGQAVRQTACDLSKELIELGVEQ